MSISGMLAGGKIGGNLLSGSQGYEFEEVGDELDGTNAASGGTVQTDVGCVKATCTLKAVFDKTTGAYTPIRARTAITDLKLYDDVTGAARVTITSAVVVRSKKSAETRREITVDCTIACNAYVVSDP